MFDAESRDKIGNINFRSISEISLGDEGPECAAGTIVLFFDNVSKHSNRKNISLLFASGPDEGKLSSLNESICRKKGRE